MKVGDLIKSNTRYKGQLMVVIDTRTGNDLFGNFQQIRVVSLNSDTLYIEQELVA